MHTFQGDHEGQAAQGAEAQLCWPLTQRLVTLATRGVLAGEHRPADVALLLYKQSKPPLKRTSDFYAWYDSTTSHNI